MKKIVLLILAIFIVAILLIVALFSISPNIGGVSDVVIRQGLVKIVLKDGLVPAEIGEGGQGITFCSFAMAGCQDIVNMNPGSQEFENLAQEQKECLTNGCLVWGIPEREQKTVELTNEQATSFVNDYKPSFIPAKDIRLKFENGKIYAQAKNSFAALLGVISVEAVQVGPKSLQLSQVYAGRIPLPEQLKQPIESRLNSFLSYEWYGAKIKSFELKRDSVVFELLVPKGIVEHILINEP